ncbi:MAG: BACON domain-containing protein [Bacteroidaceae bacterium]
MNKKSVASALLLTGAMLSMVSCDNDNTFHATSVDYPYYGTLFADQTQDSIIFTTTDNWSLLTPYNWIHIQGETQGTIKESMSIYTLCNKVNFDENTTDSTRVGYIELHSYYNSAAVYIQLGYVDISYPYYKVKSYYGTTNIPTKVNFTLADSSYVTVDSICFNARKDWNLEIKGDDSQPWVTADKVSGHPGKQKITLSMEENTSTEPRETKAILTSGQVKNEITIRQYGHYKDKEE